MATERDPLGAHVAVLATAGPFTDEAYDSGNAMAELAAANVLVVGAGGLGCEMVKDLAMTGFSRLSVIDMDTIELSNLNRQFLFRMSDVGKPKAVVAARAVMKRVPTCTITPYHKRIQDFGRDFYAQFTLVVCGLDSIEARRWMNGMLVELAFAGTVIPVIDGGTEGFQGSVKVMVPTYTACFECYMDLVPERVQYPLCTLASTPRLAEHCIEWAHQLEWGHVYGDMDFDADNMDHVAKMCELAQKRACQFGIEGVTMAKTLGVVKNIIPALASTNAIISGQCCNEAFKFVTDVNPQMDDMLFYNGEMGVVWSTNAYTRKPDCPVCGTLEGTLEVNGLSMSVDELGALVKAKFNLHSPGLSYNGVDFYNDKFAAQVAAQIPPQTPIGEVLTFTDNALVGVVHVVDGTLKNTLRVSITVLKNK